MAVCGGLGCSVWTLLQAKTQHRLASQALSDAQTARLDLDRSELLRRRLDVAEEVGRACLEMQMLYTKRVPRDSAKLKRHHMKIPRDAGERYLSAWVMTNLFLGEAVVSSFKELQDSLTELGSALDSPDSVAGNDEHLGRIRSFDKKMIRSHRELMMAARVDCKLDKLEQASSNVMERAMEAFADN